jgi:flagellar FliL protein
MSTATANPAPAPAQGKKKLILIIVAVLVLVLGGGGVAAVMLLKPKPDAEFAEDEEAETGKAAASKRPPGVVPTFVPLENFTVNLADRDAERYAQIGITLEISDPKLGDQIKAFMPAIRNRVLLAIADRTAGELVTREGKEALAEKVRRETARALGIDIPEPEAAEAEAAPPRKGKRRAAEPVNPIDAVHFSNFIVQ